MIVYYVLAAIVILGVLILAHELGHFLMAKLLSVKVLEFSLGFGPVMLRKRIGETDFLLSSIPLGGYVKMLGEETNDVIEEREKHRAFATQTILKRAAIIISGPFFNMLLAFLLITFIFTSGMHVYSSEIGTVRANSPAARAGVKAGDIVLRVNGNETRTYEDIIRSIQDNPEKSLLLIVDRNGTLLSVSVTPEKRIGYDNLNRQSEVGYFGVTPAGSKVLYRQGLVPAMRSSLAKTYEMSQLIFDAIVMLVQGRLPLDVVSGPVTMISTAVAQMKLGWQYFLFTLAFFSINLGIFNLLPIPALDGGFIPMLLIEAIRGERINEQKQELIQQLGFRFLLALSAIVLCIDLMRILS